MDQAAQAHWSSVISTWKIGRSDALKIASALSLLLILFAWFDLKSIITALVSVDPAYLGAALFFLILQVGISCARWLYILQQQQLPLDRLKMVSIYGFSLIANLFFITSLAGMSVRVALLVRHGAELTKALASVTAERLVAIVGLAIAGCIGLLFVSPAMTTMLGDMSLASYLPIAMLSLLVLGLTGVLAYRYFDVVREFLYQLSRCSTSLRSLVALVLMSVGVVLTGFCGLAALANGMGLDINPVFFIAVMPAIAVVSALPISIGGWGVREGAMVAGLSIFSVPGESALALSLLYGMSGVFVTILIGTIMAYSRDLGNTL